MDDTRRQQPHPELEPDSEALLVNRVHNAREYFQAPIDRCYALVGLIRTKWRGLSGSDEAWRSTTSSQNCESSPRALESIVMVELTFAVEGAAVDRYAAAPSLNFKLRIASETPDVRVENVLLHCQIRIEATRRIYAPEDRERLVELFGVTHRWKDTLQSMLWTHTNVQVPTFEGQRIVELPVPCSFDFNVAATKYFFGLEGGEVPLAFLFRGPVFYRAASGHLQKMDQISWSKEASYRLPVRIWQELMDFYYPNTAWLRIDRGVFEEIYRYKREKGITSFD